MKNTLLFIIGLAFLTSCSPKLQFTQSVKEQHKLTDEELKKIQFYTSGDILLQRAEKGGTEKETTEGELVITTGKSMEQVLIKAGTPGIIIKVLDDNKVAVRFEPGEGKYLVFGDPRNRKGSYMIVPSTERNNKKLVTYGEKRYVLAGTSEYVSLLFRMKKLNQIKRDEHVVKGMKL